MRTDRQLLACAVAAVLACACGSFGASPNSSARDAAAPAESGVADASLPSPPEDDAAVLDPCTRDDLCDGFEGALDKLWIQDEEEGSIGPSTARAHTGQSSLRASVNARPTTAGYAAGRLRRQVDSKGNVTWSTWVFLAALPTLQSDLSLLAIDLPGKMTVSLNATVTGLALFFQQNAGEDGYADATAARVSVPVGRWFEVTFELDSSSKRVAARIDDQPAPPSLILSNDALSAFSGVQKVDLLVGFQTNYGNPAIEAWFDDTNYRTY